MLNTKKIISLLSIFIVICAVSIGHLSADTHTAKSCSFSDVSNAVSATTYGDTVVISNIGSPCTWNSQLVISKGITLVGSGNPTIISNYTKLSGSSGYSPNFLIAYTPDATSIEQNISFRISGLSINTGNKCWGILIDNHRSTRTISNIRIDNNTIIMSIPKAITVYGSVYGVIDSNTILTTDLAIEMIGLNRASWELTSYSPGTENAMYIEDNDITASNSQIQLLASSNGSIWVARYNTLKHTGTSSTQSLFDTHGNLGASGGQYSTIALEAYGNKLIKSYTLIYDSIFYHRGGQALFFYNFTNGTYRDGAYIKPYEEVPDSCAPTTGKFPSGDNQISGQPQHISASYYWNNWTSNKPITFLQAMTDNTINCCYSNTCAYDASFVCSSCGENLRIKQNREFFITNFSFDGTSGVGCGTLANMPLTCSPGDGSGPGYWATDQSCGPDAVEGVGANPTKPLLGTLYRCTAKNTWTPFFTPYTYPHPLRNSQLQSPSNLRINNP